MVYRQEKSYDGKVQLLDVTSKEFLGDPYRFYEERRKVSPVIHILKNSWSITGYNEMSQVLSNPNVGKDPRAFAQTPEIEMVTKANPILQIINNWMLLKNPPEHKRIRRLVQNAFTPKMINELIPTMKLTMQELITNLKESNRREFDLVSSISYPFPVTIISEMMGIPKSDRNLFRRWSTDFAIALTSDISALPDQLRQRLNQSALDLIGYFEKLIEIKKKDLTNDLISTLINANEGGNSLSIAEILSNCTLLLVAGHETTSSLISNGMNALLNHPDQFDILKSDHSLIPNAIEEFLRYDAPVQLVRRFVLQDVEIDGYHFKSGDYITNILGAAGYDPRVNPDPQSFEITRKEINHLAFAKGIHYCLGANLARIEAKIAFEEILNELPNINLNGTPERNNNWVLRGFTRFPLIF
jgi:pimeloyl-[acyl-carrier protein] synthase